jgi:hypothetical protein
MGWRRAESLLALTHPAVTFCYLVSRQPGAACGRRSVTGRSLDQSRKEIINHVSGGAGLGQTAAAHAPE